MSGLAQVLQSPVVTAIYDWWKQRGDAQPARRYLGGSEIGHHCERYLWYKFRESVTNSFDGRLYRLFDRGHKEEYRFVEELRGIGCEVHEVGQDGQQFQVVAVDGHFKGHADGVALGVPGAGKTWHLLEFKTANSADFNKLAKEGVTECKPQHYAQMQVYMHLLGLTRALYMAVCKEDDRLHAERIKYDRDAAEALLKRAERVVRSPQIPARPYPREDYYLCKWCPAQALCWDQAHEAVAIDKLSCRQCCHATPIANGQWQCERGQEYGTPCAKHLFLPGFVEAHGDPVDATEETITYKAADGYTWTCGSDEEQVQSKDLICMPKSLLFCRPAEDAGGHEDNT